MNWNSLKRLNLFDIELPENNEGRRSFLNFVQSAVSRQMDYTKFCSAALGSTLFAISAALIAAKDKIPSELLRDIELIFTYAIFGILAAVLATFCYGFSGVYLDIANYLISRENPSTIKLINTRKALIYSYRYMLLGLFIFIAAAIIVLLCVLKVIGIALTLS